MILFTRKKTWQTLIMAFCLLLIVPLPSANAQEINKLEIAITIDDLPVISKIKTIAHFQEVTNKLLTTLTEKKAPAIGFVNEGKLFSADTLNPSKVQLLENWLSAGMDLGNHAFSHLDFNRVSLEAFKEDVVKGEKITKQLLAAKGKKMRYFRHPYLHAGNSKEKKNGFEQFLKENDYQIAPVTIDNSEWIFAAAYDNAIIKKDSALMKRVGEAYISYMEEKTAFYEKQSAKLFGYSMKQILLIHANSLNADYLDELLDMLSKRSYQFVALEKVLQDPAYKSKDEYIGRGGITWIDRWAITMGKEKDFFKGEPRTPEFIQEVAGIRE